MGEGQSRIRDPGRPRAVRILAAWLAQLALAIVVVIVAGVLSCQCNGRNEGERGMAAPASLSPMEKRRIDDAAVDYLIRTKRWKRSEFRVELHGLSADEGCAIVWGVFLANEAQPIPGGGKSVELHVDRQSLTVIRELGFQ